MASSQLRLLLRGTRGDTPNPTDLCSMTQGQAERRELRTRREHNADPFQEADTLSECTLMDTVMSLPPVGQNRSFPEEAANFCSTHKLCLDLPPTATPGS